MAQRVRRVSSLEEIESILPLPSASSHHKSSITSEGTNGMRVTRRARAKSLDNIQQTVTRGYLTHKGSIKTNFARTPDSQILSWLRKKLGKIGHGREDYSLFLFHKKSKFRKAIKRIVKSKLFLIFMALMVFLNAIALCFYRPSKYGDFSDTNSLIAFITITVIVIYMVEAGLRIIAYGLILHPKAYLRNTAYILDVFIILCGILYVSMNFNIHVMAEIFGSLMALKLVRVLAVFESVKFILKALASSLPALFYLIIMTLCVMVFFSLIGMELFQNVLHGGCYANYTSPTGVDMTVLVSNFPCAWDTTELGVTIGSHDCPAGSVCRFWEEGPHNGITSFDNFLLALLTVFQLITLEGWSDVFYLYESAVGYSYAWVYFLVVIFLGSVLILNLWTGVLTSVFIGVSDRGNIRRLKESKRIDEDLQSYKDWMKRAAELELPSEVGSIGRRPSLFFDSTWIASPHWDLDSEDEVQDAEEDEQFAGGVWERREQGNGCWYCCKYAVYKSRRAVCSLTKSRVFFGFGMVVLALNLIFLMALHFPGLTWFINLVFGLNYAFTVIYILETILKLYGQGPRTYFTSYILICEFVLTLINLLDVFVLVYIEEIRNVVSISAMVNACRCMALIRIFKYTRYWKAMKQILNTMFQLLWLLLSLIAIIAIFLFVFTILGLRLFGERLSRVENVVPNFDNWYSSFLVVFQLMTTEDWPSIMHSCVGFWAHDLDGNLDRVGYFAAVYFVMAVWMGGFVLVTIFLAFAVDKLSEVRSLEKDSATQNEKRKKEREAREEHIHALKKDEPQVRRRTIRMAMRYLSEYPAQRTRTVQEPRMNFLQQISLPAEKVLRRGTSLIRESPAGPPTAATPRSYARTVSAPGLMDTPTHISSLEEDTDMDNAGQPVRKPVQSNPLHLVRQSSDYIDTQIRRLGGGSGINFSVPSDAKTVPSESPSTGSATDVSQQPSVEVEASVFVYPPRFDLEPRQPSVVSTPASATCSLSSDVVPKNLPYERTQSLPVESPSSSKSQDNTVSSIPEEGAPELEVVIEAASESEGEKERAGFQRQQSLDGTPKLLPRGHPSSLSQSQVVSVRDDVSYRLDRESSLEVIQPIQVEDQRLQRRTSQIKAANRRRQLKDKAQRLWKWIKDYLGTIQFDPAEELMEIPNHSAFFILSPDNRIRQLCFRLVRSTVFQTVTYAFIFLSSLLLTLEIPTGSNDNQSLCLLQDTLVFWDLGVVVFFLVEIVLKMTALGVFLHRGSYFRGFFNTMDFTVAVTNLVPILVFFVTPPEQQRNCLAYNYELMQVALNVLRVLRVLRPLRAIRISGLYLVATGLLSSLKSIGSILFFDILALTIFAVIGTQVFRGRFYYCTDPMMRSREDCVGTYFRYPNGDLTCPVVENRTWLNSGLNFDNYGAAFLTLFVMLTAEGWQNVMYSVANTPPSDDTVAMGPDPNESAGEETVYFLLYMLVMTFVLLNLFVGFVIVTFQEVGVKSFRETKLDRNQRNCLYFALTARPHRRFIPTLRIHQKLHDFVCHYIFKIVIFVAVVLNCILLALLRNDASQQEKRAYYWVNAVFTIFFALEAVLKIIAFTPPNYFRNGWNTFEFLVALGSVVEIILQLSVTQNSSAVPESYKYSRIASTFRVLRLLRMVPKVRLILWTVIKSLEIFPWVGLLLLVVYFFYAVIGMQVFGTIEISSVDSDSQITQYNNFANFPQALLVMVRVSTGENWQEVMLDCIGPQACHESVPNTTTSCGSDFAYIFFPSFFFVSSILILNLFVAIIIDNFDYLVRDRSKLGNHQLGLFVKLWSLYDPEAKGTLSPEKVMDLFRRCNPPVGWGRLCTYSQAHQKMMTLNMPLIDGQVTFNATLFALVRTSLKIHCEGCSNCANHCNRVLEEKLKILFPRLPQKKLHEVLAKGTMHTVREEYAARLIQVQWRRFALRRRKIILMFTGGGKRVLKAGLRRLPDAGPDLSARRLSEFSLEDLSVANPMSRRESASDFFSSETVGAPFSPLEMTTGSRRSSVEFNMEENYEMDRLGDSRGSQIRRLHTIEELPESDMPITTNEEEMEQSEADLQSELSYASAYSSPVGSLHDGDDRFYQLSETTV